MKSKPKPAPKAQTMPAKNQAASMSKRDAKTTHTDKKK